VGRTLGSHCPLVALFWYLQPCTNPNVRAMVIQWANSFCPPAKFSHIKKISKQILTGGFFLIPLGLPSWLWAHPGKEGEIFQVFSYSSSYHPPVHSPAPIPPLLGGATASLIGSPATIPDAATAVTSATLPLP
jgi:hypothetical protein